MTVDTLRASYCDRLPQLSFHSEAIDDAKEKLPRGQVTFHHATTQIRVYSRIRADPDSKDGLRGFTVFNALRNAPNIGEILRNRNMQRVSWAAEENKSYIGFCGRIEHRLHGLHCRKRTGTPRKLWVAERFS